MSGHLLCAATLSMSPHISTLNYLRSADTCLTRTQTVIYWLSAPAITDSANKSHVFDGRFNPKSLARIPTSTDSSLKSPCCRLVTNAIFYVIESNEPRDCGKLVRPTFVLRHHVVKVTYSVFQPAMSKKGTIFSLDQRIALDVASSGRNTSCRAGRLLVGKTQIYDMYRTIRSRQGCHPGRMEFGRPG